MPHARTLGARRTVPVAVARPAAAGADEGWDLLLVSVSAYILVAVGRVHQLFPALQVVRPAILAGLLALLLYVIDRRAIRRSELLWVGPTKCLLALLAWMVLSVPWALVPGNSFTLVFDNFIKTVLMYLVVVGAVRYIRDIERLAAAYVASATVYAAVVLSRFELGSGDAWRLGHLYYYDANDFATFVVSAFPMALYFAHAGRRQAVRLLSMGALLILTVAFVHTGSRGGFLALAAVGVFFVFRYTAIPVGRRVGAFSVVALLVVATASDRYWSQMGTMFSDSDYNQTEESGRMQIWQRGVGYMLQYPILGVGPENFPVAEGTLSEFAERQQYGIGVRWNAPHNSLVQIGAELGIAGLLLFVAIIAGAFRALHRAGRHVTDRRERRAELAQALTASLIGFIVGAFFLSLAYSEILYTLVAIAVGFQKVTREA